VALRTLPRICGLLLVVVLLGSLVASAQTGIDPAKVIDLTYSFGPDTIYWPNAEPFRWEKDAWGPDAQGRWYAAAHYSGSEHGGTHLDSPVHFSQGKQTVDEIPVGRLVAPVVVIDIAAKCAQQPDYLMTPEDIARWEKAHGRIPQRSVVLVRTGWGKFWPEKKRYLGTDVKGDVANLHFPGISAEAARVFASRGIHGIGIDTASIDFGQSKDFASHRVLAEANVYGLENVANADKLPLTGATLIAMPMKIAGGSGAPARIVALLP